MYLDGIETKFNRQERNPDASVRQTRLEVFSQNVLPFAPIARPPNVSLEDRQMAHWFILNNSPELLKYLQ